MRVDKPLMVICAMGFCLSNPKRDTSSKQDIRRRAQHLAKNHRTDVNLWAHKIRSTLKGNILKRKQKEKGRLVSSPSDKLTTGSSLEKNWNRLVSYSSWCANSNTQRRSSAPITKRPKKTQRKKRTKNKKRKDKPKGKGKERTRDLS